MDTQYRVKRVLCNAQYGEILLCEVAAGIMADDGSSLETLAGIMADDGSSLETLAVIKQISWSRVRQASHQHKDIVPLQQLQPSDDPMQEIDVAAKICAAGNHKNVVRYHTVLRGDKGHFGIVMQYCNEGDLLKRLDCLPENRLSETDALVALKQISDGLQFLHDRVGVAHRDVSLENVLVHNGICKLGDFGLSARIEHHNDENDEGISGRGQRRKLVDGRVGKLGCMAPEVAAGGAPYDPVPADIWSLGVLFFILLTGSPLMEMASVECPAFRAFCRLGLLRVLDDWKMRDNFHEETLALCVGMLQVDPRDRITMDEIQHHAAFDLIPPPQQM